MKWIALHWLKLMTAVFSYENKMVFWQSESCIYRCYDGLVLDDNIQFLCHECFYFTVCDSIRGWNYKWYRFGIYVLLAADDTNIKDWKYLYLYKN